MDLSRDFWVNKYLMDSGIGGGYSELYEKETPRQRIAKKTWTTNKGIADTLTMFAPGNLYATIVEGLTLGPTTMAISRGVNLAATAGPSRMLLSSYEEFYDTVTKKLGIGKDFANYLLLGSASALTKGGIYIGGGLASGELDWKNTAIAIGASSAPPLVAYMGTKLPWKKTGRMIREKFPYLDGNVSQGVEHNNSREKFDFSKAITRVRDTGRELLNTRGENHNPYEWSTRLSRRAKNFVAGLAIAGIFLPTISTITYKCLNEDEGEASKHLVTKQELKESELEVMLK